MVTAATMETTPATAMKSSATAAMKAAAAVVTTIAMPATAAVVATPTVAVTPTPAPTHRNNRSAPTIIAVIIRVVGVIIIGLRVRDDVDSGTGLWLNYDGREG